MGVPAGIDAMHARALAALATKRLRDIGRRIEALGMHAWALPTCI